MSGGHAPRAAGGARRAARRARRPDHRGAVGAVALVALAAVLVVVAPTGRGPEPPPGVADAPVRHLLLGCPGRHGNPPPRLLIGSVAAEGLPDGDRDGRVRISSSDPPVDLGRGELARLPVPGSGAVVIEAEDGIAAGLFALQTQIGAGLAATHCLPPGPRWWFSGAGGTLGQASELVLDNLDQGPAVVDVRVLGPDGPVDTIGTRGLTVSPGQRVVLPLAEIAPQGENLTLAVTATRGRVVAAVADRTAEVVGDREAGAWLPAQQTPRRLHRIPGLLPDPARHTLVVTNPGEREALVELGVSAGSGGFQPTGGTTLQVPPGAVVARDLTGQVPAEAAGVLVRSSSPVLATVRARTRGDVAYLVAPPALTAPAPAAVVPGTRATLAMSAGARDAVAAVTWYGESGSPLESTTLEIPAEGTVRARSPQDAAFGVLTPGRGAVHAAVAWSDGSAIASVPLLPLPARVRQPHVEPAY